MTSRSIALLVMFIVAVTCYGQWSNDAGQNQLIANQMYDETAPKIVRLADGRTYLSWFSKEVAAKTLNYNMRIQLLDQQGIKQFGAEGLLVSNHPSQSWMTDYTLSVDSLNNAILTFQDFRNSQTTVNAYKISPSGQFLWGNDGISLSSNLAGDHYAPLNIITPANKVIIVWTYLSSDNIEKICLTKLEQDGTFSWTENIKQLTYQGTDNKRLTTPKLINTSGEDFILQYSSIGKLVSAKNRWLMARKYNSNGVQLWETVIYNQEQMTFSTKITLAPDENDGLIISWSDDRDINNLHAPYLQHINSNGSPLLQVNGVLLTQRASNHHVAPSFVYNKTTHEYVIFWDIKSPNQNDQGIMMQKINQTGELLWGNEGKVVCPMVTFRIIENNFPKILPDGNIVLFYNIFNHDNSFDNEIRMMKFDPNGNFYWADESKFVSSVISNKTYLNIVSDLAKQSWILCWRDSRNSESTAYDIYCQNINSDGVPGQNEPSSLSTDISPSADIQLMGNYPNPFNPETAISFISGSNQTAKFTVFSSNGTVVKEFSKLDIAKGLNKLTFSGVDLNSGIYFYKISTNSSAKSGKMILVK